MKDLEISTEYITLGQAMKLSGTENAYVHFLEQTPYLKSK